MKNFKNNLEKEILEKIKRGEVKQKSRMFFMLKNISFWVLSVFFVLFGAVSFASILYKISGNFEIIIKTFSKDFDSLGAIVYAIPFFWFLLLFLFLYFAIENYKKTKLFYRVNMYIVILSAIILSFVLGLLMFHAGLAQKTEDFSEKYIPFYDRYLKIQTLKKDIFIKKLKKIGVTKEILEKNPELKEKVSDKFDKNVLGKTYLYKKPDSCLRENFKCDSDEIFFSDKKGCGCREVYFDLKNKN